MKRGKVIGCLMVLGLVISAAASVCAEGVPKVVVSIKPVHSLVAAVMEGVAEPELLLAGGESPHSYTLRPSQARALSSADVIFWVGEGLESFLGKPLTSLSRNAHTVAISEIEGIRLLPVRAGGVWEGHDPAHGGHAHKHEHPKKGDSKHSAHGSSDRDMHLWLDPYNARIIAKEAAAELGRLYPEHDARFTLNAERLAARLEHLDNDLQRTLAPVSGVPFIVFHDAYQYLESRYGLNAAGSVTLDPDRTPGAKRLGDIRRVITERRAACVFSEPQFTPRLVGTVIEGTGARQGELDPLGADLVPGPDAYFTLMERLGDNLRSCLSPDS